MYNSWKKSRHKSVGSKSHVHQVLLDQIGYRIGKAFADGAYSKVRIAYKATELGYTTKVACKVVNKKKASKDFVTKFLPREISIVRSIQHPNIVTVFNIIELDDQVYMFMDFCERGDLLDHIRSHGALPEHRARHMFRQLVSAIEYLHGRDIAHRDLKCENVLLANRDHVKIADFGFARWCSDLTTKRRVLSETYCGSAAYAAPEILQGVCYNPKMTDVWSLGCILYIMLCGTMPFDDDNIKQMLKIQMGRKISFPSKINVSNRSKKFILHLLEPDVTRRATIKQVANNPWMHTTYSEPIRPSVNTVSTPSLCHALTTETNRNTETKNKASPRMPLKGMII